MQQNQLMKRTAICTAVFAVFAFVLIFCFASPQKADVGDAGQEEVAHNDVWHNNDMVQDVPYEENTAPGNGRGDAQDKNSIIFEQNTQEMNYFCIPIPADVKAENVMIENHYIDKELWVSIKQAPEEDYSQFYQARGVSGNRGAVVDGYYESGTDTFWLKFMLTELYEYHSIFEDNHLYIDFVSPKEAYDRIVVIDPAYGGSATGAVSGDLTGKQVTLDIVRALKKKLDGTDMKVYYTRMDDSNPSDESRIALANAVKADMMIRIEVNENEDTKVYGTEAVYNSKFFIPGFGSVELADLLEREVVTAISGKANGLVDATEEDIVINQATVPAATIRVGYVSNGQEVILLGREDYIEKIAEGIYQAILAAYE
ncbi:MAG: N-acetylmuramoyl-L-alanine amidase [Lachnospiraceae bacterium]|nr:N-acetylmuramoyl-L-alanine amidase [Lachnospiraceae bacterium]